jgi:hypothetical protein
MNSHALIEVLKARGFVIRENPDGWVWWHEGLFIAVWFDTDDLCWRLTFFDEADNQVAESFDLPSAVWRRVDSLLPPKV